MNQENVRYGPLTHEAIQRYRKNLNNPASEQVRADTILELKEIEDKRVFLLFAEYITHSNFLWGGYNAIAIHYVTELMNTNNVQSYNQCKLWWDKNYEQIAWNAETGQVELKD